MGVMERDGEMERVIKIEGVEERGRGRERGER
jgi:hypothetical protein